MFSEILAWLIGIGCVIGQSVEFVIAHDGQGIAGVDHGPDDLKGFWDLRASVNEVAQKDSLPLGVLVDALVLGVAECREELYKLAGMPVDVSDEVVHDNRLHSPLKGGQGILSRAWFGVAWFSRLYATQSLHNNSADSNTVFTASSCKSGGYP